MFGNKNLFLEIERKEQFYCIFEIKNMFGQLKLKIKIKSFLKKKKIENLFGNFDDTETRLYTFYKKQMKIIIQICNVACWVITNLQ